MKNTQKSFRYHFLVAFLLMVLISTTVTAFGASPKYWLKVNAKANVVTVYKKTTGQWKPLRAMLCSTGIEKKDTKTPTGTYYIKGRWDWGAMVDNVYARYCVHFYQDYLIHSVPYHRLYDQSSQPTKEFNKLGRDASHGCVRLSTMDAKWVYDNCKRGTKITIYNSSNPGPLGKPEGIRVSTKRKTHWDPTDPDRDNPYFKLKKPIIRISASKKTTITYGSRYRLKSGISAQDPNTFQELSHKLQVYKVRWYSASQKKYISKKFSTKRCGTYKVTYRVQGRYCGTTFKTMKLKVVKVLPAPKVSVSNDTKTGKPVLTWNAVKNGEEYAVYRALGRNKTYKRIITTRKTVYLDRSAKTPGKRYYYKVQALTSNKKYISRKYSSIRSRLCDLPRPVLSVDKDFTNETIRISWDILPGARAYEVYRSTKRYGTYDMIARVTTSSYEAPFEPDKTYYYKVKALSKNNVNANSAMSLSKKIY